MITWKVEEEAKQFSASNRFLNVGLLFNVYLLYFDENQSRVLVIDKNQPIIMKVTVKWGSMKSL